RREGDPPSLVASNERICSLTGWAPKRDNLEQIILSAYEWEKTI
ncbi:MAG: UDP-glucose 4-epimerase, partial [Micavibrio sp.]|nr:UDP-glucose 4-epimerase [Micavibrio sp.]